MEFECLALKDLTSPGKSFPVEPEEDAGRSEQKVRWTAAWSEVWQVWCGVDEGELQSQADQREKVQSNVVASEEGDRIKDGKISMRDSG